MQRSENINELTTALAKAQGEFTRVAFDKKNPHFKNQYASLEAIIDATRAPLSRHGLSVVQLPVLLDGKMFLEVVLMHSSGQYISSMLPLNVEKMTPQGVGSALTYGRRYGMSSILNINAGEDDDGEEAEKEHRKEPIKTISKDQAAELESLIGNDEKLMKKVLTTYRLDKLQSLPLNLYGDVSKRIFDYIKTTESVEQSA